MICHEYIYIYTHTYRVLNFLFLRGFQRIYTYRYTSKYIYIINKMHVPKPTANCWLLAHGMFPDWQASRGATASRCCISTDGNRRGAASAAAARSCGWYWASEYCKYFIMNINEYQFDMVKLTEKWLDYGYGTWSTSYELVELVCLMVSVAYCGNHAFTPVKWGIS